MRGRGFFTGVILGVILAAAACGPRSLRGKLLEKGALNVSEVIEDALDQPITVLDAIFSPDSRRILLHVLSLATGESSLWIYRLEDGSIVQNGLKPGWSLNAVAFSGDGQHVLLAAQRPDPPTYRLYQTPLGTEDWANLTDLVPTAYVKVIQIAACPDGETLAVVSAAEGHSDLSVSRGGELLLETQVYPGYVKILGWGHKGDVLYVESDMPLDLGLTMEKREQNTKWNESQREGIDTAIYAIQPDTQVVTVAGQEAVPRPDISPDGKHQLHIIPIDETRSGLFLTPH